MDLQVTQENLNKALSNVARVASGRSTLPILSNILIRTENNRLRLSATNLDIALSQQIGTKVKKEGSLTIPARLFQDFVSNLPNTTLRLVQEDAKLHVTAENYKSTINGMASDEFPVMPVIQKPETISLSASKLKQALQQVVFAASGDEARPVLTGVLIASQEGKLYIAATDSYRLSEKEITKTDRKINLLVPHSACQDLLRIIDDTSGDVDIEFDEQQVKFMVGDAELVTRQIDGQYPDYKKLIPSRFENSAEVLKKELLSITKVAGLFSRENAGSVVVSVDEENTTMSVKSIASQVGDNVSDIKGKTTGSGDITLNSRYLTDVLQVIDGEKVEFCFNGKLDPIVVRDPKDKTFTHIIMPLKS